MERKAYQFNISWDEVKDIFKKELDIDDLDWLDLNEYIEDKDQKFLDVMSIFFNSRNNEVMSKKGDVIYLEFIDYRNEGYLFYDGEKVIYPGRECGSEYHDNVPSIFKVPEFPPDYWDNIKFIFNNMETLIFDIDENTKFEHIKEFMFKIKGGIKENIVYTKIYKESKYGYYVVFLSYNDEFQFVYDNFIKNKVFTYLANKDLTDNYYDNEKICFTDYEEIKKYVDIKKTIFVV